MSQISCAIKFTNVIGRISVQKLSSSKLWLTLPSSQIKLLLVNTLANNSFVY